MLLISELILTQTIRLNGVAVSLTSDAMYHIHIESDIEVTVTIAKQIVNAMQNLQSKAKLPVIIVVEDFTLPSKETREYLAQKAASPFASAEAYVVKSIAQKLVGNFYLNVNKPERPTKIFNNTCKALDWLEKYK